MVTKVMAWAKLTQIQVFLYLQLLDFMTTLIGMKIGLGEASPFVRLLMHGDTTIGLAASKVTALLLVAVCIGLGKIHVVRWVNYWYAGLVIWNMALIFGMLRAG